MLTLKQYLKREDQQIQATLQREVAALDPVVQPLVRYTLEAGGKRIRPILAVLMGRGLGCANNEIYSLGCAVELIHTATLMHDDVMDAAALRRGRPAAHMVFGIPQAIMSGDVLLAASVLLVFRQKNYDIMECCSRAMIKTATGQVEETQSLRNPALPLEAYLRIITGKTAALLSCACEVGALFAGASPEHVSAAAEFGLRIGIAFQLVDDALDIAPEAEIGKPTGGDLREGKFTMPLDFYRKHLQTSDPAALVDFDARFRTGGFSDAEIEETVLRMRALGCDEKTRGAAGEHLVLAEQALRRLPASHERDLLLDLSKYIRTRKL